MLLKFETCFTMDVEGRKRGLAVIWKDTSRCSVMNITRNFINILIQDELKGEWRLTCYYGFPERTKRCQAWDMISEIPNRSNITW